MTYELAEELKEAGFAQEGKGTYLLEYEPDPNPNVAAVNASRYGEIEEAYVPTLSELIEACGGGFKELCRLGEGGEFEWYTEDTTVKDDYVRIYGSTPEIAVAKLWFALNKK